MFNLQNEMLKTGGQEFKDVIVADVDLSKLMKFLDTTELQSKLILDGIDTKVLKVPASRQGVEIDTEQLLKSVQAQENAAVKVFNEDKKEADKKEARQFTKENLEDFGYIELGKFYFKEPNLKEYMNIREKAFAEKDKTNIEMHVYINFLIECAYDENKQKVFKTEAFKKQFLEGKTNNPYITTAAKYWIEFTAKKDYMGLKKN